MINWGTAVLTPELVRNVKEALFIDGLQSLQFTAMHDVQLGIKSGKQILYFGEIDGLVGKTMAGNCSVPAHTNQMPVTDKTWQPAQWGARFDICADTMLNTAMVYAMRNKVKLTDLTDTDWADIVMSQLTKKIQQAYWRTSWFGDKTANNYNGSPAGEITNGVDKAFVNMIDGFWKQAEAQAAINPDQHINIASNEQSTTATQFSHFTPALALGIATKLRYDVDVTLRNLTNGIVLCTQSFYDKLEQNFIGTGLESMYENLVEGVRTLRVLGYNYLAVPEWDKTISTIHNNGTKLLNPHRAIYIARENLAIGTPSPLEEVESVDMWYEKKDRKVYIDMVEMTDAKIIYDNKFVIAI
jgi:hypothetical protein